MPCPICGELIATQAKKCRFCGEILGVSAAAAGNCQRPSPGDGQSIPAPAVAGNCPKTDSDYGVKTSPKKKKGIVDYLSDAWERKYDFDGRATQREYWYVMPIFFVLMIVLGWIVTEMERGPKIFLFVLNLVVFCSMLALSCRRCHDANLSGAVGVSMMLFFQIGGIIAFFACKDPSGVIGMLNLFFIVGIIVIGLLPGTKGENKYGPVP
ncbi:MAG: DUF805 domain-containing protein [Planctomycetes bacterium]|nr:DUF805 domain-containing protein [Planctomycetota bacterium]